MEEQVNEEDEEPEEHVKKMDKIISKCAEQLDSLWSKIDDILTNDAGGGDDLEKASTLSEEINKITSFLIAASKKENLVNVACVFCEKYQPFYKIYNWTGKHRACLKQMACEQLRYFKEIVYSGGIGLITSKHIMIPLYLLLLSLQPKEKRKVPLDIELLFINILYYLSQKIENPVVLSMLSSDLYTDDGFKINKYTFFELLILYTHNPGEAGNIARQGILSCVKVALNNKDFSQYISQESSGCIIIAAGLSGRFSSLPTTLEMESDDWNCITKFDVEQMAELKIFLQTLKFCCNITEVGNKPVTNKLCSLIYESFLSHVIGPVLNQSSIDSQISITAYLDLFLRSITSTHIMRIFLRFLLTDMYDNRPIIDILISHINSETPQLSIVALQLFKTLLELNCEDVLYHLIFRYLIGCYHVVANQKRTIKEVDFYCKSATMFLYLTPQCCIETKKQTNETVADEATSQDGSTSSATPEMKRKLSTGSTTSNTSGTALSELRTEEALDFMCYLHDVKRTISACKKACSCWSAVYDGMDVITENNIITNGTNGKRSDSKISFMDGIMGSFDGKNNPSTMTSNLTSAISKIDFSLNGGSGNTAPSDDECLGPFLNAIFDKIDSMIDNNVYVNLMLTSLVSRLACYPQPLLRSFLLNSNLVIKPGVRSLVQVIARVSSLADGLVGQLDDFKLLIVKAQQALRDRELTDLNSVNNNNIEGEDGNDQPCSIELDCSTGAGRFERANTFDSDDRSVDSLLSLSAGSRNKSHNTCELKMNNANDLETSALSSPANSAGRLHPVLPKLKISKSPKKRRNIFSKSDVADLRRTNPGYIRNAIYCVVILEEFMKELAAVSIEQTLL